MSKESDIDYGPEFFSFGPKCIFCENFRFSFKSQLADLVFSKLALYFAVTKTSVPAILYKMVHDGLIGNCVKNASRPIY